MNQIWSNWTKIDQSGLKEIKMNQSRPKCYANVGRRECNTEWTYWIEIDQKGLIDWNGPKQIEVDYNGPKWSCDSK